MNKYIKYIFVFIVVLAIAIPFGGSYSVQSIDDLAYLVALGIDEGENEELKVTFEFTKPTASGDSSSSESSPIIINSVEANSLDSAINLMNTYVSKEINLSHCKAIVISEKLAFNGISKLLFSLMNKVQIRPDANIIISKCLAKEFVENTQPTLEDLVAKYYEIAPISSEYTGYTANTTIGGFFNQYSCQTCEPSAILGAISTSNSDGNKSNGNFSSESSSLSGTKAGFSPLENTGESEMMGLAVFKGDQLVGELDALETLCSLLIRNDIESCNLTIPNPNNKHDSIDLYIYPKSSPDIKVKLVNGSPFVYIKLNLESKILSYDSDTKYITEEKLSQISDSASQYIEDIVSKYLYKTAKEYKADISGIGKYATQLFTTSKEYEQYNWRENYKDSFFDINVDINVESALLLSGS